LIKKKKLPTFFLGAYCNHGSICRVGEADEVAEKSSSRAKDEVDGNESAEHIEHLKKKINEFEDQ